MLRQFNNEGSISTPIGQTSARSFLDENNMNCFENQPNVVHKCPVSNILRVHLNPFFVSDSTSAVRLPNSSYSGASAQVTIQLSSIV